MTTLETVIAIVVVVTLALCLIGPTLLSYYADRSMFHTLSNMKTLRLATVQMALDRATNGNTNGGWPGDIGGSFSNWTSALLKGGYLSESELCKLLSVPGNKLTSIPATNTTGILVYDVREDSDANVVFLSTANFTNSPTGGTYHPKTKPFRGTTFAVFRKVNQGNILDPQQAGNTNLVGGYAPLCR